MNVKINISQDIKEPYAVIHTDKMTDEIQRLCAYIQKADQIITANENDSIVVLQPKDIYMISSKGRYVEIFCLEKQYTSKKCLYEFEDILEKGFMRISKTTIINLSQIDRVEPSFDCTLQCADWSNYERAFKISINWNCLGLYHVCNDSNDWWTHCWG